MKKDFLVNLASVSTGLDGSKADRNDRRSGRLPQSFAEVTSLVLLVIN